MTKERRFTIPPDVMTQEVSGETVLLDLSSEGYYSLDAVGTRIWQLLGEKGDLQAVFDQMLLEYEVESERLEQDLADLIRGLLDAGLVEERAE